MTVSKEIAEKAARYEKLVNETTNGSTKTTLMAFTHIRLEFRRKCMGKNNRMVNGVIKS